ARRGAVLTRKPRAVLHPHAAPQLACEPLCPAGASSRRAPGIAPSREALEEHLREEVVRGPVGFSDQAAQPGRADLAERLAAEDAHGQVGATRPTLDADAQLLQPLL